MCVCVYLEGVERDEDVRHDHGEVHQDSTEPGQAQHGQQDQDGTRHSPETPTHVYAGEDQATFLKPRPPDPHPPTSAYGSCCLCSHGLEEAAFVQGAIVVTALHLIVQTELS